jgi:hypothetical protein
MSADTRDDVTGERPWLKNMQLAILNILEDATTDRLGAETAARASLNILEDPPSTSP